MRILVVGDWHSNLHEEAVFRALTKLGHEVHRFAWSLYFQPRERGLFGRVSRFARKAQNKFIVGPRVTAINRDFLDRIATLQPELVFIYRGTHITRSTLRKLREVSPHAVVVGYNNDDPFAEGHPFWLWRHFRASIPEYDLALAYRHHNLVDFKRAGAKRAELLRSWYLPEYNFPMVLPESERARFECDVAFIGHYEPDGRLEMLEALVNRGVRLRLYGPEWEGVIPKSSPLSQFEPIRPVRGEDYNKALNGAKIALCFFSKLNRDTYTRRCFEIPATRTLLLSEYSADLASMYSEGREADFFRSKSELLEKVERYLAQPERIEQVAQSGYIRLLADGHDVVSRMKRVLAWVQDIVEERRSQAV